MPLTLVPSIDALTREEYEAFLNGARARRLSAALVYHEGVNAKLLHEQDKLQRKLSEHYVMLEKEMFKVDRAIAVMQHRLDKIDEMQNEITILGMAEEG